MRTVKSSEEMSATGMAFESALNEVLDESSAEDSRDQIFRMFSTRGSLAKKSSEVGTIFSSVTMAVTKRLMSDKVKKKKAMVKKKKKSKKGSGTEQCSFKPKSGRIKEIFVRSARYAKENPGHIHPQVKIRLWGLVSFQKSERMRYLGLAGEINTHRDCVARARRCASIRACITAPTSDIR